jgi:hypothetical protein
MLLPELFIILCPSGLEFEILRVPVDPLNGCASERVACRVSFARTSACETAAE